MQKVSLNARFYAHRPTGMQRYCLELVERLGGNLNIIRPPMSLRGGLGHLWEQTYLPLAARKDLLWSPNNTGPVTVQRQVCTIHDVIPLDHPEWFSPRFVALYRWLLPRLVRNVQHIIAVSHFTKTRLVDLFSIDPDKVSVVPNGADLNRACPERGTYRGSPAEIWIGRQSVCFMCRRDEPRKNLGRLLAAWSRLPREFREGFRLVVAGAKGMMLSFAKRLGVRYRPKSCSQATFRKRIFQRFIAERPFLFTLPCMKALVFRH